MHLIARLLIFLGLAWLTFVLFTHARAASVQENVDPSQIAILFAGVLLAGGIAGALFVITVLPAIGEMAGNLFFQPNESAPKSPHADAQAALARGDYAEAVEEYRKAVENDPNDLLASSEIAKIQCEHLGDPAAAATLLEELLQREWPPEDAAFLSFRLVDVYWNFQRDAAGARALLLQVIETMPVTRHAANAEHRLKEIQHQIALGG